MKTFTLFFPNPEHTKSGVVFPDGFVLGQGMLIDGIAVSIKDDTHPHHSIVLGEYQIDDDSPREVVLDNRLPPEIVHGYIFDTELQQVGQSVIALQSSTPTRHRESVASPLVVRVCTRCGDESKLYGVIKSMSGSPRQIASGIGYNRLGVASSGVWHDTLFQMAVGDALQVRPGGLTMQREWVLQYKEIGLTHGTLENVVG